MAWELLACKPSSIDSVVTDYLNLGIGTFIESNIDYPAPNQTLLTTLIPACIFIFVFHSYTLTPYIRLSSISIFSLHSVYLSINQFILLHVFVFLLILYLVFLFVIPLIPF